MAKRKNLGFSGVKEVYVSKTGVPKHIIEELKNAWNTTPLKKDAAKELRKIKLLNIKCRGGQYSQIDHSIDVSCIQTLNYIKFSFIHELAHCVFDRKARLDNEKLEKFISTVKTLPPITAYVKSYQNKDKNRYRSYHIYYDEYHSAIAQTLSGYYDIKGDIHHDLLITPEQFEIAKNAYIELHDLT